MNKKTDVFKSKPSNAKLAYIFFLMLFVAVVGYRLAENIYSIGYLNAESQSDISGIQIRQITRVQFSDDACPGFPCDASGCSTSTGGCSSREECLHDGARICGQQSNGGWVGGSPPGEGGEGGGTTCTCTGWTNQACGGDSCPATMRWQTQTCSPTGCSSTSKCVSTACFDY